MPIIETLAIAIGTEVAKSVLKRWLQNRTVAEGHESSLSDMINSAGADYLAQRSGERQFETLADKIAEELLPLFEGAAIPDGRRKTIAWRAQETIAAGRFDATVLLQGDLEPSALREFLLSGRPEATRDLSKVELDLYDRVIDESASYIIDIASQLPSFAEHSVGEVLRRETAIISRVDEVLREIRLIREGGAFANQEEGVA